MSHPSSGTRLAAIQLTGRPGPDRLDEALASVVEAGRRGASLAVLPETFLGMERPEPADGPAASALARAAASAGVAVVAPLLISEGGGLRNGALVLDRAGQVLGIYRKVHCTRTERDAGVVPGGAWPVFDVGGLRLGVLICHDLSFPESARILRLEGAEVLAWPHVQSGWGDVAWEAVLRARAIDQGAPIVSSSFGRPAGTAWRPGQMVGRSGVVGADGTILADAGRLPGVVTADIDFSRPLVKHDFSQSGEHPYWESVLADRRPELYGRLGRA